MNVFDKSLIISLQIISSDPQFRKYNPSIEISCEPCIHFQPPIIWVVKGCMGALRGDVGEFWMLTLLWLSWLSVIDGSFEV